MLLGKQNHFGLGFLAAILTGILASLPQTVAAETIILTRTNNNGFFPRIFESTDIARNFDYGLNFDLDATPLTLELDTDAGTARLTGTQYGSIVENDRITEIGSATGDLDILFSGVRFNEYNDGRVAYAVGYEGEATSSGTFDFNLDFNSLPDQVVSTDVFGGFANPDTNGLRGRYGFLENPFNIALVDQGDYFSFEAWVKSGDSFELTSLGAFSLHGDIHAQAEVPEPSTILLLGVGALGLAFRKRQIAS